MKEPNPDWVCVDELYSYFRVEFKSLDKKVETLHSYYEEAQEALWGYHSKGSVCILGLNKNSNKWEVLFSSVTLI